MRKLLLTLFAVLLTMTLAVTGFAQTADLELTDVEAKPGDTVYLTVALQTKLTADAMGLSYTYDEKILAPMPVSSWSWEVQGAIKNFDTKKHRAVWGANEPTKLQGDICVMAFRVLENAKLTQTKVTCELIVKNQGEEIGTYTAEGLIGKRCEHEYGPWSSTGNLWHVAECKLCGKTLTQSHMWDDGEEATVDGKRLMRYVCTVCRETREVELSGTESQVTKPTGPADQPTETFPTVHATVPTQGTNKYPYEDDAKDTTPTAPDEHAGHDHQNEGSGHTSPEKENAAETTGDEVHDHTHGETTANTYKPVTGIVVGAVLVVLLIVAVYIVKKK